MSTISTEKITEIKDENGYVVARIHGELDVEALTRCLYGFKQKVEHKELKKSG